MIVIATGADSLVIACYETPVELGDYPIPSLLSWLLVNCWSYCASTLLLLPRSLFNNFFPRATCPAYVLGHAH